MVKHDVVEESLGRPTTARLWDLDEEQIKSFMAPSQTSHDHKDASVKSPMIPHTAQALHVVQNSSPSTDFSSLYWSKTPVSSSDSPGGVKRSPKRAARNACMQCQRRAIRCSHSDEPPTGSCANCKRRDDVCSNASIHDNPVTPMKYPGHHPPSTFRPPAEESAPRDPTIVGPDIAEHPNTSLENALGASTETYTLLPEPLFSAHVLAATSASQHLSQIETTLIVTLTQHHFKSTDFYLQAGFDEQTLMDGIGMVECIFITFREVSLAEDAMLLELAQLASPFLPDGSLLIELARLISPFPGCILMQGHAPIGIPVLSAGSGAIRAFHEAVYAGAKTLFPLTESFDHPGSVLAMASDSGTSSGGSSSGFQTWNSDIESGTDPTDNEGEEGEGEDARDGHGHDKESGRDRDPGEGHGKGRKGMRLGGSPAVNFSSKTEISSPDTAHNGSTLPTTGAFSIVGSVRSKTENCVPPRAHIAFDKVKCQRSGSLHYSQCLLRVAVDTRYPISNVAYSHPLQTRATAPILERTRAREQGWKFGFSGSTGGSGGLSAEHSRKSGEASTNIQYPFRVMRQEGDEGLTWWGFVLDDEHDRATGIDLAAASAAHSATPRNGLLPEVTFEFLETMTPPPETILVEVASYWSTSKERKRIFTEILQGIRAPRYHNLCHRVVLRIPSNVQNPCHYFAKQPVCLDQDSVRASEVEVRSKQGNVEGACHVEGFTSNQQWQETAFNERNDMQM